MIPESEKASIKNSDKVVESEVAIMIEKRIGGVSVRIDEKHAADEAARQGGEK